MARFYGFGESEIMAMSFESFTQYLKAIPILQAQEMLRGFTVATFPHMSVEAQRKEHRKIYKTAFPSAFEEKKPMSLEDLARILRNGQ